MVHLLDEFKEEFFPMVYLLLKKFMLEPLALEITGLLVVELTLVTKSWLFNLGQTPISSLVWKKKNDVFKINVDDDD